MAQGRVMSEVLDGYSEMFAAMKARGWTEGEMIAAGLFEVVRVGEKLSKMLELHGVNETVGALSVIAMELGEMGRGMRGVLPERDGRIEKET